MTRDEARKYVLIPFATSTDPSAEYLNQKEAYDMAIEALKQPEIIFCKDCKHYAIWQLKSDYTDDLRYKPSVCVIGAYSVHRKPDWFCADAERRTDE